MKVKQSLDEQIKTADQELELILTKINAVRALYGKDSYSYCDGNGVVKWKDGHETTKAETTAINSKYEELLAEYDANQYQRDRQYPSIGDQLDMQYHDQLDSTTTWKDAVAKVKADHPKPK